MSPLRTATTLAQVIAVALGPLAPLPAPVQIGPLAPLPAPAC